MSYFLYIYICAYIHASNYMYLDLYMHMYMYTYQIWCNVRLTDLPWRMFLCIAPRCLHRTEESDWLLKLLTVLCSLCASGATSGCGMVLYPEAARLAWSLGRDCHGRDVHMCVCVCMYIYIYIYLHTYLST